MRDRLIKPHILKDLPRKIVLLSGPRQVGKTTLAKGLSDEFEYLNYDTVKHRKLLLEQAWRRDVKLVIFDELHKLKHWKSWLKGIYDDEGLRPPIIVTGSARLDIAKKMGDSLAGRHFLYRLHPITLFELKDEKRAQANLDRLMQQGGFPEPFYTKEQHFYERWQRSHLDLILRQDLLDLENVKRISDIETLIELLRYRVGSPVSYQSLAEDLQVDATTIKRWLILLENLFVIFKVSSWSRSIRRSLSKSAKYYFFDNGQVADTAGARFENLVANEILSAIHFEQDTKGRKLALHFIRNREGREIDFVIVENNIISALIEAKWSDDTPERAFKSFAASATKVPCYQVVGNLKREKELPFGLKIVSAHKWLGNLQI